MIRIKFNKHSLLIIDNISDKIHSVTLINAVTINFNIIGFTVKNNNTKTLENLQEWLEKDNKTEPELAYWIIKYILMRNSKPWSEMVTCQIQCDCWLLVKIK